MVWNPQGTLSHIEKSPALPPDEYAVEGLTDLKKAVFDQRNNTIFAPVTFQWLDLSHSNRFDKHQVIAWNLESHKPTVVDQVSVHTYTYNLTGRTADQHDTTNAEIASLAVNGDGKLLILRQDGTVHTYRESTLSEMFMEVAQKSNGAN